MKKKSLALWVVLIVALFALLSGGGGCGGSDDDSSSSNGGGGTYSFEDMEGTWDLVSGNGTLSAGGYTGTGKAKSGYVTISNIKVEGETAADADVKMESVWEVSAMGYTDNNYPINYDSSVGERVDDPPKMTRKNGNTFEWKYWEEFLGGDRAYCTMTITLTSATTATVTQEFTGAYTGLVTYSVKKRG
ncbi:MAG: hypothetical protein LBU26_00420 [Synergistaceae bacterium]|nr:hypothetical protein [Synergistaceae bacterium]